MLNALMNVTCNIELTIESSVYDKLFVPKDDREGFYFWYHVSNLSFLHPMGPLITIRSI